MSTEWGGYVIANVAGGKGPEKAEVLSAVALAMVTAASGQLEPTA
jgi:hypothetical protein